MHKDVAKAIAEARKHTPEADEAITIFLRNLPNSTNTEHGVSLWYPTRILVELTEEKEHGG